MWSILLITATQQSCNRSSYHQWHVLTCWSISLSLSLSLSLSPPPPHPPQCVMCVGLLLLLLLFFVFCCCCCCCCCCCFVVFLGGMTAWLIPFTSFRNIVSFTWVRLQQPREQRYQVLPLYVTLYFKWCAATGNTQTYIVFILPLFFDFQLPRDLLVYVRG